MNPSDPIFLECLVQIKDDESFEDKARPCPAGFLTIGYGRNVDPNGGKGITEAEAQVLLSNDITECDADLRKVFAAWDTFSLRRKATLLNLRFQLGPSRFRVFRKMIAAIEKDDWELAAAELRDSHLMTQTPRRTSRRASELEQG